MNTLLSAAVVLIVIFVAALIGTIVGLVQGLDEVAISSFAAIIFVTVAWLFLSNIATHREA